jgi:hypothetical protein
MACYQFLRPASRRSMLRRSACGFGQIALAGMLGSEFQLRSARQLAAGEIDRSAGLPHFPSRAQRIIFLFMWGGPSHVDLFDPKPLLNQREGQDLDGSSVGRDSSRKLGPLLGSPFKFAQYGQGGVWISELFPHLARQADQLCVIRSLHTEGSAHGEALLRLHTGQANLVRPSVGSWISYGLGRETDEIPAFITISPPRGHGGVQNYGSAFLPARHQGTAIGSAELPIASAQVPYISNPKWTRQMQREQLDLVQQLNQSHLQQLTVDRGVEGLIANYELAYRMQSQVPQIMDVDNETESTLDMYGINRQPTDNFGRQCLLARKFAEAGVRYIQVSTDYTWDHHNQVVEGSRTEAAKVDMPIAGLLADLRQRGMLEDTLVLWGAEFGRTPMVENSDGRNHHPQGFSMWMAGGGVRGGLTYGATDEFGYRPIEQPMHMHDLHATLLYALGIDHQRLTFTHAGRDFRLTDVHGNIATEIFS